MCSAPHNSDDVGVLNGTPVRDGPPVLDGVRVLDLATGIAAPYAAMFLADQGADVVKIEAPDGDPYRSEPGFQTINRNKRSVVEDVGSDQGAAQGSIRSQLIAKANIIFTDQPGAAAQLRALNPGAVIISMSPWGERSANANDPSSRSLLHAASGIAWNQQSYGEVPVDVVVPVAAYGTGVLGALAAVTGWYHRQTTGSAATYEVSEVAGAAAIQLGEFRFDGDDEPRPGDSGLGSKGRVACYRLIEAGDQQWFFLACGTPRFYERMLAVIDRSDLLDDPLLANPPWGLMLDDAIARITPILDEVFATKPRDEWLRLLAEADVPAQPVLTRDEFLQSSVVAANDMDLAFDHPELGQVRMMGTPVSVDGSPGGVRRLAPPLGAHTDEVLEEWLLHPDVTAESRGGERPLAGLNVIDLAGFIAGPVVSRHLAMLGADVVKVEPPSGDPFRAIGPMFASWNQGKRSVVLDLTTRAGRAALHDLVAEADVVIENFRPGVSARLGCDHDTLRSINPNLVFLSSPGFGLDATMADSPAFDPLVQALGGFMAAQGGWPTDGPEPVFLSVPIHDVMTPMIGAFGVVLGLLRRVGDPERSAQLVRTSLVQSTMAAQAAEFTRFEGAAAPDLGGFDFAGPPTSTWVEEDGDYWWVENDNRVRVERHGLTGSALARENNLVVTQDSPDYGRVVVFGQLVGGAGPHPDVAPSLDAH